MFFPTARFILPVPIILLLLSSSPCLAAAQDDHPPEIGGTTTPSGDDPSPFDELGNLEAQLDVSARYTRLTGQDMNETYGGVPAVTVGGTFRISRYWRLFLSGGYGRATGDPYHGTPGIIAEDTIEVRYAPFNLGLKYDLARSAKVRVYFGLGFEFSWIEETIPLQGESGEVADISSSGVNKGFTWSFGPEFVIGRAGKALGLEIGGGGSKGTITSPGHSHDVDLTGYRGRAYLVFPL